MKILNKLKEYKVFIIVLVVSVVIFNIKLPYYVMAPGGIINMMDRITVEDKNDTEGSVNLLYVSEYDGTVASLLMASIFKEWDIFKLEEKQVASETPNEIHNRNKIMLDNSVQNAQFVAYNKADKEIKITDKKNLVLAVTDDNGLKIGDEILKVNNKKIEDIRELKQIINHTDVADKLKLLISRDGKQKELEVTVREEKGNKIIGIIMVTNYNYELDPEIEIKFKEKESGPSGGLMTALSTYIAITDEDIVKKRNIAGTGTIDIDGTVGEIDGIKYKIMGAVKNNMDLIFVPQDNYKEATKVKEKYKYDLEIIGVSTFEEVINYLKKP